MSKAAVALGVALALSVGFNIWQASGEDPTERSPARGVDDDDAPRTVEQVREVEVCKKRLERCELTSKARPLLFGSAGGRRASTRSAEQAAEEPIPFLCELARDEAKALWKEKEQAILFAMRQSLADPELQARDVDLAVERFGDHLELSQSDREALATEYEDVRLDRIERVRREIAEDPPDYEAVIRESKALFEAEDKIAAELFGDEAAQRLQDAELDSRSRILSIAASLGDLPWDEHVVP